MTRSLRRWHRILIAALALTLAALFISALIVRRPPPVNPQIPQANQTHNSQNLNR